MEIHIIVIKLEKYRCNHMNRLSEENYLIQYCCVFGHLPVQDVNPSNRSCAFKSIILVFITLILCLLHQMLCTQVIVVISIEYVFSYFLHCLLNFSFSKSMDFVFVKW